MKFITAATLLLLSSLAVAQDYPKAEVFGGYSYLHVDTQDLDQLADGLCSDIDASFPGACPPGSIGVNRNFHGWNAAAEVNVNRWFGIKADFSGHYGKLVTVSEPIQAGIDSLGLTNFPPTFRSYSFLFGPVISHRSERTRPFVHALFGVNRLSTGTIGLASLGLPNVSFSENAFAMAFGGGLDVKAGDHITLRVAQGDYLYTGHDFSLGIPGVAAHQNNFRFSAGIVFTIGGKKPAPAASTAGTPPAPPANAVDIPSLGVSAIPGTRGLEVVSVQADSPAARAGIRSGDFIIALDKTPVRTPEDVQNALGANISGTVKITYMIRGQWQTERVIKLR